MTAQAERMIVTIPAADLLSAIWYGDGSGSRGGLDVTSLPDQWVLTDITYDHSERGQPVRLHLARADARPPEGGA